MKSPNQLTAYEHTRTHRYHLDWKRIPVPRSGLELSHGPWFCRKRSFLDAFPCPMARLGTAGRKRNSGVVLVLEHRRKRADVYLFYFPARSCRHSGVFAELTYLHSQSDADPKTQVRVHRRRAVATPTRSWLAHRQLASRGRRLCSIAIKIFGLLVQPFALPLLRPDSLPVQLPGVFRHCADPSVSHPSCCGRSPESL